MAKALRLIMPRIIEETHSDRFFLLHCFTSYTLFILFLPTSILFPSFTSISLSFQEVGGLRDILPHP